MFIGSLKQMHAGPCKDPRTATRNEKVAARAVRFHFAQRPGWFCAVLLLAASAFSQGTSAPRPPIAKQIHVTKSINGAVLTDDYVWRRDKTNPEAHLYLEAENNYAPLITADAG